MQYFTLFSIQSRQSFHFILLYYFLWERWVKDKFLTHLGFHFQQGRNSYFLPLTQPCEFSTPFKNTLSDAFRRPITLTGRNEKNLHFQTSLTASTIPPTQISGGRGDKTLGQPTKKATVTSSNKHFQKNRNKDVHYGYNANTHDLAPRRAHTVMPATSRTFLLKLHRMQRSCSPRDKHPLRGGLPETPPPCALGLSTHLFTWTLRQPDPLLNSLIMLATLQYNILKKAIGINNHTNANQNVCQQVNKVHNPNMKEVSLLPGSPTPFKDRNMNRKITLKTVKSPLTSIISSL